MSWLRTLLVTLTVLVALPSWAATPQEDPVALAQLMVRDGHWDRARQVLLSLDENSPKIDHSKRHATWGLIHLNDQKFKEAAAAFSQAIATTDKKTDPDPLLRVYMAQALVFDQRPSEALEQIQLAGTAGDHLAQTYLIRFRAHNDLNQSELAWTALREGQQQFPNHMVLKKQRVIFLIESNLTEVAIQAASAFVTLEAATLDDGLDIAALFRQNKTLYAAQRLLEALLLRFGDQQQVLVAAAAVALEQNKNRDAGWFLERASQRDAKYAIESAEAYRKAGISQRALYMNAQAVDSKEKTRQRFGLYIQSQQYERAISMKSRLKRLGLLSDDSVKYGLAYCYFHTSDPIQAESLLTRISDKKIFQQAIALREAMAACEVDICW